MPNCKRGWGRGGSQRKMGGKSNPISIPSPQGGARAAQEEPSRTAAAAAKVVAAEAVAAGRGMRPCVALSARVLFQELGVAIVAWHHSALAVRYPRLGLDCTMGQLMVIMRGWMMSSLMTPTSMMRMWPGGGGGSIGSKCGRCHNDSGGRLMVVNRELGGAATTTLREHCKA